MPALRPRPIPEFHPGDHSGRLLHEFDQSPERIRYRDEKPEVIAQSCLIRDGRIIQPAGLYVNARRIDGPVRIQSLIGVGDAMWTRGIVRAHLDAGMSVAVDTMFQWAFWDFVGRDGFSFWDGNRMLAVRHANYLGKDLSYQPVYEAMWRNCHIQAAPDFKLPIKPEWTADAAKLLDEIKPQKPVMVYRPLVDNHSRKSVSSRNPDHAAYSAIFRSIRDRFHVISVSGGGGESIVHADHADTTLNNGEISLTTVVALMSLSSLVYTCAGMGLVVASAIGAPVIGVMGGYEGSRNYQDTTIYGLSLLIDCMRQCFCMSDAHPCDKTIHLPSAIERAKEFCDVL